MGKEKKEMKDADQSIASENNNSSDVLSNENKKDDSSDEALLSSFTPEEIKKMKDQMAQEMLKGEVKSSSNGEEAVIESSPAPTPRKKKKTPWEITKSVIDTIFTIFIAFIALILIVSFATKGNNYGVPSVFGYQVSVVATNSMQYEPYTDEKGDTQYRYLYPVGTGIVCKKVDFDSIQVGDDILFSGIYSSNYKSVGVMPTIHRVFEKVEDIDGTTYYLVRGVNTYETPSINTQWQRVYENRVDSVFTNYENGYGTLTVNEEDKSGSVTGVGTLMGKLVSSSKALGTCIKAMQTPWCIVLLILIPCGVIAISSIIDIVKLKKTPDAEVEAKYGKGGSGNGGKPDDDSLNGFSDSELSKLKSQMAMEMLKEKNSNKKGEVKKEDVKKEDVKEDESEDDSLKGFTPEEIQKMKDQMAQEMLKESSKGWKEKK